MNSNNGARQVRPRCLGQRVTRKESQSEKQIEYKVPAWEARPEPKE